MIDIVSERLYLAAPKKRALRVKTRVLPVGIVGRDFVYDHEVDQKASAPPFGTPGSDYIVTEGRMLANAGLASREGAYAVKRVRSEPVIMIQDIGMQAHL